MKKWCFVFFVTVGVFHGINPAKSAGAEPSNERKKPSSNPLGPNSKDLDQEVKEIISVLEEKDGLNFDSIFKEPQGPLSSPSNLPKKTNPMTEGNPREGFLEPVTQENAGTAYSLKNDAPSNPRQLSEEIIRGRFSLKTAIENLRQKTNLPAWKAKMTCPDVLSGVAANPPDQAVNFVCQLCYTYCMALTVIAEYVTVLRKKGILTEKVQFDAIEDFEKLYPIADSLVRACEAGFWAFLHGNLRNKLNDMQVEMQQQLLDREKPY